jgi:hypothetical protein
MQKDRRQGPRPGAAVTLLLECCHTVVTLSEICYCIVVALLSHFGHVLLRCSYTISTLSSRRRHTFVILWSHYCCTLATLLFNSITLLLHYHHTVGIQLIHCHYTVAVFLHWSHCSSTVVRLCTRQAPTPLCWPPRTAVCAHSHPRTTLSTTIKRYV